MLFFTLLPVVLFTPADVELVVRLIFHPIDFQSIWKCRLFDRLRVGIDRPVVGMPEIEKVGSRGLRNA